MFITVTIERKKIKGLKNKDKEECNVSAPRGRDLLS